MATGIVSIAAAEHGFGLLSGPLALLAVIAMAMLMYLAATRWRTLALADLDTVIGLFTYVAAGAVLAARFAGHRWAVWVLGAMALQGWLTLVPMTVSRMRRLGVVGLRDRARGTWELPSVATSGLAIVFMTGGAMFWAFLFWIVALCVYCVMTLLIAWRAIREPAMRCDVPSDHWILMGGLAIATLAGDHIHAELHPGPIAAAVGVVTLTTLIIATVQIVPLAITGWRQMLDWPTVFPLGMYSEATSAASAETGWHSLVIVSLVFLWIAFAVWLAVAAVEARRLARLTSGHGLRPE